jgi:hypothetical protein
MSERSETTKKTLALLCVMAVGFGGCFTRKTPAKPVVNFIAVVHPIVPPTTQASLESPPDLEVQALPAPPEEIAPARLPPARPHVAAPVVSETGKPEKTVVPTITPEVDTEQMKAAQAETERSLERAEKNLAIAQGRKLSPLQEDLASKVRGFADNAREAMQAGDWVKAKNFSTKAEVLAEQLAASF